MSTLEEFESKLKSQVKAASDAPRWQSAEIDAYMGAVQARRQQFDQTAQSLIGTVVKPRLEAVARRFPSARAQTDEQAYRAWCWFACSDRFPVTAKLEFAVEHEESIEHLLVRYEAWLMPVFMRFQPHDRLTMPLDAVNSDQVAGWVEERIFEFLATYLQQDRGQEDLEEDIVTDPVCGMRLRRSDVRARADYRGHPYFFCSAECQGKFGRKPEDFVTVRTM